MQARRDIVAEYEQACDGAGARAGWWTWHVRPGPLRAGHAADLTGDWLLIHVTRRRYAAIAICRGHHPVFFRRRGADGDGQLGELVHQTAMYYQDRLGGAGSARVVAGRRRLARIGDGRFGGASKRRVGVPVESMNPTEAVPLSDRVSPAADLVTR